MLMWFFSWIFSCAVAQGAGGGPGIRVRRSEEASPRSWGDSQTSLLLWDSISHSDLAFGLGPGGLMSTIPVPSRSWLLTVLWAPKQAARRLFCLPCPTSSGAEQSRYGSSSRDGPTSEGVKHKVKAALGAGHQLSTPNGLEMPWEVCGELGVHTAVSSLLSSREAFVGVVQSVLASNSQWFSRSPHMISFKVD